MTSFRKFTPVCAACLLLALALGGCSTVENFMGGDKVDYRSAAVKTNGLDVPPDLTQLARDTRYQQPGGTVSAARATNKIRTIAMSSVRPFRAGQRAAAARAHTTIGAMAFFSSSTHASSAA